MPRKASTVEAEATEVSEAATVQEAPAEPKRPTYKHPLTWPGTGIRWEYPQDLHGRAWAERWWVQPRVQVRIPKPPGPVSRLTRYPPLTVCLNGPCKWIIDRNFTERERLVELPQAAYEVLLESGEIG